MASGRVQRWAERAAATLTPPPNPPRLLYWTALGTLLLTVVLSTVGAFRVGITTDEPIHVMRLRHLFTDGWYALDWDYRGAGPGSEGTNTFVYGPVAMLLLHLFGVLVGTETWGEVSTSPAAYDVRHLGVVLIATIGLAATAGLGRTILGSWRWGVVAAGALAAIPMWTGHAMANIKDIPVATGYTLVTLGLVLFLTRNQGGSWRRSVARAGVLIAGLVLCLGTRPGMWSGVGLAIAVTAILIAYSADPSAAGRRRVGRPLAELTGSLVVASILLVAIYPNLFAHPLRALPQTTEASASFLAGERVDRFYVPRHVLTEMPLLLLAAALTGLALTTLALLHWRGRRAHPVSSTTQRLIVVGVQATAMPVAAIVFGADLYHGLRQLLFAAPAVAVFAAVGMAALIRPQPQGKLALLAAAALALPLIDQVTLQPYQTSYVNLATDVVTGPTTAALRRPGGDFWRASLPELLRSAPSLDADEALFCKATVTTTDQQAYGFVNGGPFSLSRSTDCRAEPTGPLSAPGRLVPALDPPTRATPGFTGVFLKSVPPNCTPLTSVTRWRHGFRYTLTVLARCTVAPPTLTIATVESPSLGNAGMTDLWRFAVLGWQRWPGTDEPLTSASTVAGLALRAPSNCRATGCAIALDGDLPDDLQLRTATGVSLPVENSPAGGALIPLTGPARDQAISAAGLWLTLSRPDGRPLDLTLRSLRLLNDPTTPTPSRFGSDRPQEFR